MGWSVARMERVEIARDRTDVGNAGSLKRVRHRSLGTSLEFALAVLGQTMGTCGQELGAETSVHK